MPNLSFWTGVIPSRSSDENEYKSSNAKAENWFRIVKHPIMEDKMNTKAGHLYLQCIDNRESAYKFGFTYGFKMNYIWYIFLPWRII